MPSDSDFAVQVPRVLLGFLDRFPPRSFERGDTLIHNTYRVPTLRERRPMVAYIVEGLVRASWNRSSLAPGSRATALVAGDCKWVGFDAFRFGENFFKYHALTPTTASVVPLDALRETAPRGVLLTALKCVSLDWFTAASISSLRREGLRERTLMLLYEMRRLHPRPELELRQADVADLLGVARQTLHRTLAALAQEGLIELGYAEIRVIDFKRLMEVLREARSKEPAEPLPPADPAAPAAGSPPASPRHRGG